MILYNCDQGTDEWFRARLGIPTASRMGDVLAGGKDKTRSKYMRQLLGERITGMPAETFSNHHMARGQEMQSEAEGWYETETGFIVERVGFGRMDKLDLGASPDLIVGCNGLAEVKTKLPDLLLEVAFSGKVPSGHIPQIQSQILVFDKDWCDFVAYWPRMKPVKLTVHRDDKYINEVIIPGTERFLDDLEKLHQRYNLI